MSLPPPTAITFDLVARIEVPALAQAFRQAKSHGRVVSPLTGFQIEGAAADHIGNGLEGPAWAKFGGCAYRITDRQAVKTATGAIDEIRGAHTQKESGGQTGRQAQKVLFIHF